MTRGVLLIGIILAGGLGGCPDAGGGGATLFSRTGRFSGRLTCVQTNSAPDSDPVEYTSDLVVEIRSNGELLINGYFYYQGAINPITLYDYTSTETVSALTVTAEEIVIQVNTTSFLADDGLAFEGTKTITLTPAANGALRYTFRWFDASQPPAAPFAVETECETVLGPAGG